MTIETMKSMKSANSLVDEASEHQANPASPICEWLGRAVKPNSGNIKLALCTLGIFVGVYILYQGYQFFNPPSFKELLKKSPEDACSFAKNCIGKVDKNCLQTSQIAFDELIKINTEHAYNYATACIGQLDENCKYTVEQAYKLIEDKKIQSIFSDQFRVLCEGNDYCRNVIDQALFSWGKFNWIQPAPDYCYKPGLDGSKKFFCKRGDETWEISN